MLSGKVVTHDSEREIENDGFWPNVKISEFQEGRSIPLDIAVAAVDQALLSAATQVNAQLLSVKERHIANGIHRAIDVACIRIGNSGSDNSVSALVAQYKKAVFARAKADLLGEFASVGRMKSHAGQESDDTREILLAEAAQVIRSIKGLRRIGVALV